MTNERRYVIDAGSFTYKGIFDLQEFLDYIDSWLDNHGYMQKDISSDTKLEKDGRFLEYIFEPMKKVRDNVLYVIRIELVMHGIKKKVIEKKGVKRKYDEGDVSVLIHAFVETDFENRYEQRFYVEFFRSIMDKFIYEVGPLKYDSALAAEGKKFLKEMKAFLNLYKYHQE